MPLNLDVLSALSAFIAAALWFAAGRKPAQPNPTTDGSLGREFEESLHAAAKANRRAAVFAGVAALLQGVASLNRG
jgi:hypothetical protein